jgi:hypothetical protein
MSADGAMSISGQRLERGAEKATNFPLSRSSSRACAQSGVTATLNAIADTMTAHPLRALPLTKGKHLRHRCRSACITAHAVSTHPQQTFRGGRRSLWMIQSALSLQ